MKRTFPRIVICFESAWLQADQPGFVDRHFAGSNLARLCFGLFGIALSSQYSSLLGLGYDISRSESKAGIPMGMLVIACRGGVHSNLLAATLLSVFSISSPLWSQGSADYLRRTIDVVVTDKAGRPVTGLGASDFEVFENNAYHPIATALSPSFQQKETRFLAFIFDNVHFSLQASGLARQAALQMLAQTGPNMRVAVFWVGKTVRMIQPFTTDRAATRSAIELVTTPGQTRFDSTDESTWPKNALNAGLERATEAAALDPLGTNGAGAVLVLSSVLNEWPGRKHAVIFSERPQDARIHLA
jgi:hypothetical protein